MGGTMTEIPLSVPGQTSRALSASARGQGATAQSKITVDDPHLMVRLLGTRDESLRLVEQMVRQ